MERKFDGVIIRLNDKLGQPVDAIQWHRFICGMNLFLPSGLFINDNGEIARPSSWDKQDFDQAILAAGKHPL